ncbi:MAG: NapC/NirT family cytochrome c [Verrucomicrobia bacterium]|nr:NapC/NirT family cytochrome c [Verrucomicrobiota bacterium]MDE3099693.1 NapC/NirT family cytochrome c [Verrucomicrobiota bacterium]
MQDKENSAPRNGRRRAWFQNWLSLGGAVIAASSIFAVLLLFSTELFLPRSNPYMGLLVYVLAPVFFFAGLALMVIGLRLQRRLRPGGRLVVDLTRPRDRKRLGVFIACAAVFLLCTAIGSYQTYQYTDSVQFCGTMCHVPMKPEYTTYLQSPHARVACVECHVGPGAGWYVRSKLNGVHQLFDVMLGTYPRPIQTPLGNLRPAKETCEQCHWPQRFIGGIDRTFYHYLSDESNSPFAVRLMLKVGGGAANGTMTGIHWHVSPNFKVEYLATDRQRQIIPWVRVTDLKSGKVTVFKTADFHGKVDEAQIRTMDCLDCHTRPSHRFLSPDEAVDAAITSGQLSRAIPWIKSNSVAILVRPYHTTDEAMQKIAAGLRAEYPRAAGIDRAVAAVQGIYSQNFFPEMKADWRVHPDNIGHKISNGCFRCHDGNHATANGKTIPADNCNLCHTIMAQGSGTQLRKLSATGYDFFHIDSTYQDFSCAQCHNGGGGSVH